jgi:putative two-component system response regulator
MVDISARRHAEMQLADAQLEILERLALAAEYRDDDTGAHTRRVGESAAAIATALGLPQDEVELIRRAAPLHDVGKIAVPDAILRKPGRLTPEEFDQIKEHTVKGAAMLSGRAFPLLDLAQQIALTHHERWDGQGYPNGLAGDHIPLPGRIVAVADVFDALTHDRVYKEAWPAEEALHEIQTQAGRQFDPDVVEAFLRGYRERHPAPAAADTAQAPRPRSPALADSLTINPWRPQPTP